MNRILIIESDSTQAESLGALLTKSGIEIVVAPDGRTGLNKLRSEIFDIYYTGINLPDMETQKLLLEAQKFRITAPAIILASEKNIPEAIELGLKGIQPVYYRSR
ncbi:response regulator [Nitrospirota bacterium]